MPQTKSQKTKYIFISGGVISGLGKGTLSAALATLLKSCSFNVFPIKADMYLNIDAGTMNPLEHGETFVLDCGLECDQDLGTYERFLGEPLNAKNYFTAGQIYQSVLTKERQLKYNGACVEAYPHIPLEIVEFINRFPKDTEIVIVEFGGTVGEYQNEAFFEAARKMVAANPNDVCFLHVGYIPFPPALGEFKSKPMQMSISELNSLGIFPDLIVCRSEYSIDDRRREKIAHSAGLPKEYVFSCPNVDSIYFLPVLLTRQNVLKPIFEKLKLEPREANIKKWEELDKMINKIDKEISIGIVGKYYSSGEGNLEDSYISVKEAIKHASWKLGTKVNFLLLDSESVEKTPELLNKLKQVNAIIVPQGWGSRGHEGKIAAIKYARENKVPYLGLCFGMQMAAIEIARDVLNLKDANTQEANPDTKDPIIHIMPDQKKYLEEKNYGGTIRLGSWPCKIEEGTLVSKLYNQCNRLPENQVVAERHRHRYEFNNDYKEIFEKNGVKFCGTSPDGKLVEALELDQKLHPFFIGTQFHPELISRAFDPHPLFLGLIQAALDKQKQ
ncbi:CTP synthase [Candidatus Beckwithbacteria bacterium]|nr:CTP synthase [Candidatus Beckwithbacteria bacterium]